MDATLQTRELSAPLCCFCRSADPRVTAVDESAEAKKYEDTPQQTPAKQRLLETPQRSAAPEPEAEGPPTKSWLPRLVRVWSRLTVTRHGKT